MSSSIAEQRKRAMALVRLRMEQARRGGVIRLRVEDQAHDGRTIRIGGRDLVNFGSAAYLGLNTDDRLKKASRVAVERFGSVFSSSAAYVSVDLYADLEERLTDIFGGHVLIPTTVTLGHLSVLPVLIGPDDLVLMDHQVHASVQLTGRALAGLGTEVRDLPHNDMERLHRAVSEAYAMGRRVWYLADGVYSMFGDTAPVLDVLAILEEFDNLYVYFDDAHGVGWKGHHGIGHVLSEMGSHERVVVIGSLAKSWGAGGAVVRLPSESMAEDILLSGATFTFSGPLHPAELGAAAAAAEIHLSPERSERARHLMQRIDLMRSAIAAAQLPALSLERTPLWFVRVGHPEGAIELSRRLMADGFYANVAGFPVVPQGMDGIRFTTTTFHTEDDIERFVASVARNIRDLVATREVFIDLR